MMKRLLLAAAIALCCATQAMAQNTAAHKSINNVSAGGAVATATIAGVAGVSLRACVPTVAVATTATGPSGIVTVVIRDGASGVGAIIWTLVLSAPASATAGDSPFELDLAGTPGNAMTIEFTAGATNSAIESVSLTYAQNVKCAIGS